MANYYRFIKALPWGRELYGCGRALELANVQLWYGAHVCFFPFYSVFFFCHFFLFCVPCVLSNHSVDSVVLLHFFLGWYVDECGADLLFLVSKYRPFHFSKSALQSKSLPYFQILSHLTTTEKNNTRALVLSISTGSNRRHCCSIYTCIFLWMLDYCIWIGDNFGRVLWPYAMLCIISISSSMSHSCQGIQISNKCSHRGRSIVIVAVLLSFHRKHAAMHNAFSMCFNCTVA